MNNNFKSKTKRCSLSFLFVFVATFLFGGQVYAQGSLSGTVISGVDKQPMIGVIVTVDGTSAGTATDIDGNFTIPNAPAKGALSFSYVGYETQKSAIVKGKKYLITMNESAEMIEEVVKVGYGTMRKKEVTGAVTRVDNEELAKIATSDLGTSLQGLIAGVNVQAASGEPGAESNIQIRGLNSVTGSNSPLYVVDGIPYDSDPRLSSNEIASIDILKDAASAAIYGTRGAGGVILITTKSGEVGKAKASVTAYYGLQNITSDMPLMNSSEYIYTKLLENRLGINNNTDDVSWTTLRNSSSYFFNNSNMMDVIQNDMAPIQNYTLNITGGTKNLTYSLAGGFFSQDGVIINSGLDRYTLRSNTTLKSGKWTINNINSVRIEDQDTPGYQLLTEAYKYKPTSSMVDPNQEVIQGNDSDTQTLNTGTLLARIKETNEKSTNNFTSNVMIGYDFSKAFKFTTRLGFSYTNAQTTKTKPLFEIYDQDGNLQTNSTIRSLLRETYAKNTSLTWESMLDYNKTIGKHSIKATGVFSTEKYGFSQFYAEIKDLSSNDIGNLNGGTTDAIVGTGSGQWGQDKTSTLVGMMARVQYNYAQKYLLSASIRRDGSSRFAEDNRWGMFPSLSVGWNISEEPFWKSLKSKINSFKFRASYGTTGNQNFGDYAFTSYMTTRLDYAFGSESIGIEELQSGLAQIEYSNSDVKWETTQQVNLGLDASMYKNKLTVNFDVYNSDKSNMLFSMSVPPSAGAGSNSTVVLNVGNMRNRGAELAVSYRNMYKKLNYRLAFTASTNQNEITSMGGEGDIQYFSDGIPIIGTGDAVTALKVGYPAGSFFVMPTNGIINTEDELVEYQKLYSDARMGDLMYVDSNGDGVIDDTDRVFGGHGAPEYELGLTASANWKGFDASINLFASLGNEIINGSKIYNYQQGTHKDLVYQWSYDNIGSEIPRSTGSDHNNYREYTDMWVEDGSFLRVKNLTLGYSLPKKNISKMSVSRLRIYVAADNLFTITGYDGYDPEVGSNGLSKRGLDIGTYPITRQFRAGVQLDF